MLGGARPHTLVALQPWPILEENLLVEDTITLPVQVNGASGGRDGPPRRGPYEIEAAVLQLRRCGGPWRARPPKKSLSCRRGS